MNVVVLGATSGIAVEIERIYAARGAGLGLYARRTGVLNDLRADLAARGAAVVECTVADLAASDNAEQQLRDMSLRLGGIDVLILAYGLLGSQQRALTDPPHAKTIMETDFVSATMWLLASARVVRKSGTIAVLCSVAGDRGRKSNFVYGAAKAALAVFSEGLAHELSDSGPHLLVVKLGLVDTPMTAGLGGPRFLMASPAPVAAAIVRQIDRRRATTIYVPWYWRWVMAVIRMLPARLMHRTSL